MNNTWLKNSISFVVLVFIQALIFNHIDFLGYINPMIYLLFIIQAPYKPNRTPFLLASFLMGLSIDIFSDTGGIHAASSVFVAYIRTFALTVAFGKNFEYQPLKLSNHPFGKVFTYVSILIITHHTLFYFLEIFNFNHLLTTFVKAVLASIISIIVCLSALYLFSSKKL
ncbi:rod shape-determining protein MreD [Capnocytophaga canimorsus]|uniref:rod shape-determining protein MreD n=1 Tax=Capnocytophaga canimorsus TaxID=28188 RepID=UPI00385E8947